MDELLDRGKLVAGGPYDDGSGALFIYDADSTDEADAIVAADPYTHRGAIANHELKTWEVVKADPALLPNATTRVAGPPA